ncbi:unnamed protein product [Dicrocoelium dendriticum]|nr:unnamed protein product [Dicrocoelium dendriticum]
MMSEFDSTDTLFTGDQENLTQFGKEDNHNQSNDLSDNPFLAPASPSLPTFNDGYVMLNTTTNAATPAITEADPFSSAFNHIQEPHSSIPNGLQNHVIESSDECDTWRLRFDERIAKKDIEEEKALAVLKETASKELDAWYKQYRENISSRAKEFRAKQCSEGERGRGESVASKPTVTDTAVWERICDMCDFQSKHKTSSDLSRMRGVLLSLKPMS